MKQVLIAISLLFVAGSAQAAEELTADEMDKVTAAGTWQAFDMNALLAAYSFSSGATGRAMVDLTQFRARAASTAHSFNARSFSFSRITASSLR